MHLVLVSRGDGRTRQRSDFRRIGRRVGELEPEITPLAVHDRPTSLLRPEVWRRPALVMSPKRLLFLRPLRGATCQGRLLTKSQEYRELERHGVPLPRWALVTPRATPDLTGFDPYVVVKPDFGSAGASVKIKRRGRVRWKRPDGTRSRWKQDLVVQEFIYTGRWPVSYRVTVLFGNALFAWRAEGNHSKPPLEGPGGFRDGGVSILSSHRGCTFTLCNDTEIIALGERAHAAFPDIPLLGVDILRDRSSGQLFVIEVNASGYVWHLSSPMGVSIQGDSGLDFEGQFGATERAARVLVEETRRRAR